MHFRARREREAQHPGMEFRRVQPADVHADVAAMVKVGTDQSRCSPRWTA